jgi:hypothetical protein
MESFMKNRTCLLLLNVTLLLLGGITLTLSAGKAYGQTISGDGLKFPWAGGLNSCTFGTLDINLDGRMDLLVFERFGNRVLPFIQDGTSGTIDYSYHPEYDSLFPSLQEWVEVIDYNCDGKPDLFTYNSGGIRVYKNISDTILKFRIVTNLLQSFYYTGYTAVLGTPVDFPAFADIDGDGDIDLLTFFGLGSYVEFHRNLSMEKYGTCDSLDYKLMDNCWGDFKESEGGNKITLDALCPAKSVTLMHEAPVAPPKHTGSTMLATDLNGDGVKDLLLGDVDFPNIISLINGGTSDSAHMISMDSLFPGTSHPVRLFSFPSCSSVDVDNDGKTDLVISPFDPASLISENYRSVWFYQNIGTNTSPQFQFRNDRLFQDGMIDVGTISFPMLCDINGDGLTDLVIGDYGYYDSSFYKLGYLHSVYTSHLAYFQNTGSANLPVFHQVTDDFGNLSSLNKTGLYPAFGDLDGDGDLDLLLGNSDGSLIYLENRAGSGRMPEYAPPVYNYQHIDVGNASAPQLFDLDKDGLTDLVIGRQDGRISFYKNTGTKEQPVFSHVTDSLGKVNVTNPNLSYYGYSTPFFFSDKEQRINLLVGSEEGRVHYFTAIENNLSGVFLPSDSLYRLIGNTPFIIRSGWRTAPCIGFLSDPAMMDLLVGNYAGGVNYYTGKINPPVVLSVSPHYTRDHSYLQVFPNPAGDRVHLKLPVYEPAVQWTLVVYNSMGIKVSEQIIPFNRDADLSVSGYTEGLYLLILLPQSSEAFVNRQVARIVVKH